MEKITQSFDYNFNFIVLGKHSTGKTSLLSRYFHDIFHDFSPTIGIDLFTKSYKIDDNNVLLTGYDTAGSERYNSIT